MRSLRFCLPCILVCVIFAATDANSATFDNPLARAEADPLLQQLRGYSLTFALRGGALRAVQREAFLDSFGKQFDIKSLNDQHPTL